MKAHNRGGKRENAGRKPKADELTIIEKMDKAKAPDEVWQILANKVSEGDLSAVKLWLAYRFGQPQQKVEQSLNLNSIPILNIDPLKID